MNVLITGAGFIGSHLARHYQTLGWNVYTTGAESHTRCIGFRFDAIDWKRLPRLDAVFHLAGITDTTCRDHDLIMDVNTRQAQHFLRQAVDHAPAVVYASSAAVYGAYRDRPWLESDPSRPLNVYGHSKAALDDFATSLHVVGLRFSNVYGRGEDHKGKSASMIWQLVRQMREGPPTLFKYGGQRRDFVFVNDVVAACAGAVTAPAGIYNVGSGRMWTFNDVVNVVNRRLQSRWRPIYVDNPIAAVYQDGNLLDIGKAAGFGYAPQYDLERGVNILAEI